ncbi:MAG: hypothetical protein IKJ89_09460 [Kiritimatiellae bacterium]|nr:hypothetical protein [Kiritimatiellia bacterium]
MKRETEAAIMDCEYHHTFNIWRHYAHAREKHPHFADVILDSVDTPERIALHLRIDRERLKLYAKHGCVRPIDMLECEVSEVMDALAHGDNDAAVEELYDAVAVLLRTIDVLEGRQTLGKPKKEGGAK